MTMLFTQPPPMINISDRTACADHFVLPPRSASAKLPSFEPILRVRAPTPSTPSERSLCEKRSSREFGDQPHILAPCPKKAAVIGSNLFSPYLPSPPAPPAINQSRWGLWPVLETTEDEVTSLHVDRHEANHSFEAAACAELLEIMSNSRGSSRSSSKATSPLLPPQFDVVDDYLVEPEYLPEPTQAMPIPSAVNMHLMVDDDLSASATLFGTSPIVRTRNPLPNDSSFFPPTRRAADLPLFRSRRILGDLTDANVMHPATSRLCDAVSEMRVACKPEPHEALQTPTGFAARPRSYSVGDKRNNFAIAL